MNPPSPSPLPRAARCPRCRGRLILEHDPNPLIGAEWCCLNCGYAQPVAMKLALVALPGAVKHRPVGTAMHGGMQLS